MRPYYIYIYIGICLGVSSYLVFFTGLPSVFYFFYGYVLSDIGLRLAKIWKYGGDYDRR